MTSGRELDPPASFDSGWLLVERAAPTAELVTALPDASGERLACLCSPSDAALVVGSAQQLAEVDLERVDAKGASVVRRRSGGGAVFVEGGGQVWLDVFLPAGDPLLVADVGRSAWWLGELWTAVLDGLAADRSVDRSAEIPGHPSAGHAPAPAELAVHRGGLVRNRWSRSVCFAGLGPGEVTSDGRKLVGISQRRDRGGAWLHSMALCRFDAAHLAAMLLLGPDERSVLRRELDEGVAILPFAAPLVTDGLRRALA
ncbi:MAG: lipoyl protein ligase domain-containing protein [Acidimicrobiales bacterium]